MALVRRCSPSAWRGWCALPPRHRNVPMEVAIGIAVCPDDGTEAPALAARADLGVYSARATGRSIAHTDPPTAS